MKINLKKLNSKTKISTQGGQAFIIAVVFLLFISMSVTTGVAYSVSKGLERANDSVSSKEGFFLSEAISEDVIYRIQKNMNIGSESVLVLNGNTATATIELLPSGEREILAVGRNGNFVRKINSKLSIGEGVSFNYGVQVGNGGIVMENTSSVEGNIYSNGTIVGQNSNVTKGDAISAGPSGMINGAHVKYSAYANTIKNSTIDKDAYYKTIASSIVGGVSYPNSPDQATSTLPISDEMISGWEEVAEAGNVINCSGTYTISSNITLGPTKINCNLSISGSPIITLAGPLWVKGNITFSNTAVVVLSSSVGGLSVPIIADNPENRSGSGKIIAQNSVQFISDNPRAYILLVSQNNSSEEGGSIAAISAENTINGDLLLYAGHGEILLKNSISLKEVAAYKVHLQNSAKVIYETGLANVLFSSGPGGGYEIESWGEVE